MDKVKRSDKLNELAVRLEDAHAISDGDADLTIYFDNDLDCFDALEAGMILVRQSLREGKDIWEVTGEQAAYFFVAFDESAVHAKLDRLEAAKEEAPLKRFRVPVERATYAHSVVEVAAKDANSAYELAKKQADSLVYVDQKQQHTVGSPDVLEP